MKFAVKAGRKINKMTTLGAEERTGISGFHSAVEAKKELPPRAKVCTEQFFF